KCCSTDFGHWMPLVHSFSTLKDSLSSYGFVCFESRCRNHAGSHAAEEFFRLVGAFAGDWSG
ncbi:hypothetical protein NDU88_006642, partial [Pleurodeles waltl]